MNDRARSCGDRAPGDERADDGGPCDDRLYDLDAKYAADLPGHLRLCAVRYDGVLLAGGAVDADIRAAVDLAKLEHQVPTVEKVHSSGRETSMSPSSNLMALTRTLLGGFSMPLDQMSSLSR